MNDQICSDECYMPHLCSGNKAQCLMRPKSYLPMFADINGRACVVIGGGLIAQRKVTRLLDYGAKIKLISPMITQRLKRYVSSKKIHYIARTFRAGDLSGAWLVYASTDNAKVNVRVFKEATKKRIFANVVDETPLCSFITPSIMRKGSLTIAVSTGGASPSIAKRLRHELEHSIGVDYSRMLKLLRGLRGFAKKQLPNYNDRKRYFDRLVTGRVFQLVRAKQNISAKKEALLLLKKEANDINRLNHR